MSNVRADRGDMRKAGIGVAKRPGTPRSRMKAFDSLPPDVRFWLAHAAFNYDPRQVARAVEQGVAIKEIILGIIRTDRDMTAATAAREGRNAA